MAQEAKIKIGEKVFDGQLLRKGGTNSRVIVKDHTAFTDDMKKNLRASDGSTLVPTGAVTVIEKPKVVKAPKATQAAAKATAAPAPKPAMAGAAK